jgi:hypothetical protein
MARAYSEILLKILLKRRKFCDVGQDELEVVMLSKITHSHRKANISRFSLDVVSKIINFTKSNGGCHTTGGGKWEVINQWASVEFLQ